MTRKRSMTSMSSFAFEDLLAFRFCSTDRIACYKYTIVFVLVLEAAAGSRGIVCSVETAVGLEAC